MMNQKFVEEQKEKLLKKKQSLEKQLKRIRSKKRKGRGFLVRFPIYGRDVDSDIQEVQDYSENLSLAKRLSELLRETNTALKLIRRKKYGICIVCRKPIPEQRLKAFPAALTHADCKKPIRFWQKIRPLALGRKIKAGLGKIKKIRLRRGKRKS